MKINKLENLFKRAYTIAENSPDAQTKVGCIIVRPDGSELGSSYNGFVPSAPDEILPNTREEGKHDFMNHAEWNIICQQAKHNGGMDGCIAIITLSPCMMCCRLLWTSGIKTIYFHKEYKDFKKQLNMKDLKLNLTKIGKYTKIELEVQQSPFYSRSVQWVLEVLIKWLG